MTLRDRLRMRAGGAIRVLVPTRVIRNPITRHCYEWLAARDVVGSVLLRYELANPAQTTARTPTGVLIERTSGLVVPDDLATAADEAVVARADEERIGHAIVSTRPVPVPSLGGRIAPIGPYIWGVSVVPAARGRGIGTALVANAVGMTAEMDLGDRSRGADESQPPVWSLIAPDNIPSRRIFRRNGFAPTGWTSYVRVRSFERRFGDSVTLDPDEG